jgi:hypothetical protein
LVLWAAAGLVNLADFLAESATSALAWVDLLLAVLWGFFSITLIIPQKVIKMVAYAF